MTLMGGFVRARLFWVPFEMHDDVSRKPNNRVERRGEAQSAAPRPSRTRSYTAESKALRIGGGRSMGAKKLCGYK